MINITEHGVKPDGSFNSESIQKVIDKCAEAGGGTLLFPPGKYLTGVADWRGACGIALDCGMLET